MTDDSLSDDAHAHATQSELPGVAPPPDAPDPETIPDDPDRIEGSEVFRLLAESIDRRLVVRASYKGGAARRICPDRIGIDDDGQYQVEAFQLSGPSSRGSGEGQWKCFHLHNVEVMGTEDEGWVDGPRASTASNCFHLIVHPTPGTQ